MHLAQLNIADAIANMESPIMADFVNATDRINAIAAKSKGYIWSLEERPEEEKENKVNIFQKDSLLVNMTVWENRNALFDFVYNTSHKDIMIRKKEWFNKMPKIHMVLWYVPKGHKPKISEGKLRLDFLQKHGESPFAFSFKSKYTPKDIM